MPTKKPKPTIDEKIEALQEEIKQLYAEDESIQNKIHKALLKIQKLENEKYTENLTKTFKVGDFVVNNMGITNYHCEVLVMYEILQLLPYIEVRKFTIGYSDGDYYCRINKDTISYAEELFKGKVASAEEVKDIKKIITDPDTYETSIWNISK